VGGREGYGTPACSSMTVRRQLKTERVYKKHSPKDGAAQERDEAGNQDDFLAGGGKKKGVEQKMEIKKFLNKVG